MGNVRIKVDVGAEYPPKPIRVFIDNRDNNIDDYEFVSPKSFDQAFEVPNGRYVITVSGMNQIDDKTTIEISGDFDPNDGNETSDENYACVFYGTVS